MKNKLLPLENHSKMLGMPVRPQRLLNLIRGIGLLGALATLAGCATVSVSSMSCERTKPATVVYDDRYRIDFSLPTDMSLLSFLGDPNLLDVATRIRPTSRQSALIVMLGSDRVRDAERYLVYVTLEYSTDPQRSRPPTLERVLEHAKSRSSAEVPWSIETLGKIRWVVSDGLDLEVDFHQTDTKSWFWRNPSQTFIRPIDDDVDLHVSSEFNLNRESRPAGWLEARSACTLKFVSSISISEIKR